MRGPWCHGWLLSKFGLYYWILTLIYLHLIFIKKVTNAVEYPVNVGLHGHIIALLAKTILYDCSRIWFHYWLALLTYYISVSCYIVGRCCWMPQASSAKGDEWVRSDKCFINFYRLLYCFDTHLQTSLPLLFRAVVWLILEAAGCLSEQEGCPSTRRLVFKLRCLQLTPCGSVRTLNPDQLRGCCSVPKPGINEQCVLK